MHSRIFEISTDPIPQEEHMTENDFDYDHWFFHDVADYVTDDANRDSSVEWLFDSLTIGDGLITVDGDSFILHEGYQAAYWGNRHQAFVQLAETLQGIAFEEFAQSGVSVLLYQAEQLHEQKFGLYVVARESGDELTTLDEFIRYAKAETRYYIGGTIDYHA